MQIADGRASLGLAEQMCFAQGVSHVTSSARQGESVSGQPTVAIGSNGNGWEVRVRPGKRAVMAVIAVLALLGAGGGWFWLGGTDGPAPKASAAPPAISKSDVDAISSALNSGDPTVVRSALAISPDQPLDPDLVPGITKLQPIHIDASTLKAVGSGTWQAAAQVGQGAQRGTWTVFLTKADSAWKLAATAPAT